MTGNGLVGYREVVRTRGWGWWCATAASSRFPDAMAPLAFVLLGASAAGSFTVGGLASGAHMLCEAVAAPFVTKWSRPTVALLVRAVLYAVTAATATVVPAAALVALAAAAGVAGAGVQGLLRGALARMSEKSLRHQAFSLDTVILEVAWTVAPALVAGLAAVADPRLALAVMAVVNAVAAATAGRVRDKTAASMGKLPRAAGTLALGLVAGSIGGALDVATPPRLVDLHTDPNLTGLLFAGYSVASVLGGVAYGLRRWPLTPKRQASVLLIALPLALLPAAVANSVPVLAGSTVLAGLFAAPLITTRSMALQQDLPESDWDAGFGALYAVNGAGYGLASILVGGTLFLGATTAYVVPLALAMAAGAVGLITVRNRN
ncbi:MFS transporter [Fodinicola acaciae]|uniref:MFS transporter n=1 Tax=Fodinicola acaciae TaxID=2681555 RepID=UPI0013CF6E91|nr:MFS transporter [Fodinicola acaciae]